MTDRKQQTIINGISLKQHVDTGKAMNHRLSFLLLTMVKMREGSGG